MRGSYSWRIIFRAGVVLIGMQACTLSPVLAPTPIVAPSQTAMLELTPGAVPSATRQSTPTVRPTATPGPTVALTPAPRTTDTLAPAETATPAYTPRLAAYFYGQNKNNSLAAIPAGQLTDLIYAFLSISADGECASSSPAVDLKNFSEIQQLKQQTPQLKLLVSVGGWSHSARFSEAAATEENRARFARSCIAFIRQNGFDGIDLDWEFPVKGGLEGNLHRPEDRSNFTALLAEFRKQLDAQGAADGKSYLLSIAAPAGEGEYVHFDLAQIAPLVDWITLMAYDFYTGGSPVTHFNAPLFGVDADPGNPSYNGSAAVQAYQAMGVPAAKILLGVPFYGRAWQGVGADQNGLFQADNGPYRDTRMPAGTWGEGGEIEYRALKQYYLDSWPRFWQEQAQAPWLYSAQERVFITYEDPQSLAAKANYARVNRLGGISIWQISSDDSEHSLLQALAEHLKP